MMKSTNTQSNEITNKAAFKVVPQKQSGFINIAIRAAS